MITDLKFIFFCDVMYLHTYKTVPLAQTYIPAKFSVFFYRLMPNWEFFSKSKKNSDVRNSSEIVGNGRMDDKVLTKYKEDVNSETARPKVSGYMPKPFDVRKSWLSLID